MRHFDRIECGYMKQMQWQMRCTGRKWVDFVSYDPRVPAHLQLYVQRANRDDSMIAEITEAVIKFNADVDARAAELLQEAV